MCGQCRQSAQQIWRSRLIGCSSTNSGVKSMGKRVSKLRSSDTRVPRSSDPINSMSSSTCCGCNIDPAPPTLSDQLFANPLANPRATSGKVVDQRPFVTDIGMILRQLDRRGGRNGDFPDGLFPRWGQDAGIAGFAGRRTHRGKMYRRLDDPRHRADRRARFDARRGFDHVAREDSRGGFDARRSAWLDDARAHDRPERAGHALRVLRDRAPDQAHDAQIRQGRDEVDPADRHAPAVSKPPAPPGSAAPMRFFRDVCGFSWMLSCNGCVGGCGNATRVSIRVRGGGVRMGEPSALTFCLPLCHDAISQCGAGDGSLGRQAGRDIFHPIWRMAWSSE